MAEPGEKVQKRRLLVKQGDFNFWLHNKVGKSETTLRKVADAYAEVFNMQGEGEWGESWSAEEALRMLSKDFFERSDTNPLLVTMEKGRKVEGFSIGYNIKKQDIGRAEMPYHLPDGRKDALLEELKGAVDLDNEETILFFKELGIRGESRGGFEKVHTLLKSLIQQGEVLGAKKLLFWTSRDSRLYKIVMALGAKEVVNVGDPKGNIFLMADISFASQVLGQPTEVLVGQLAKKGKQ